LRKETDILDVWFDSGSSHAAVLGHRPDLPWPSDVYLEGGDQYRGWFHSSLLVGMVVRGGAPYRAVLTNGWVLDAQGRAMSKSLGNVIDPNEVIKSHGAEILRLWVASIDFREDVVISPDILARLSEAYRKLRNTFRYCLSNLYDFDPARDSVRGDQLEEIDAWAHVETAGLLERVYAAYQEDAFHKVYRAIYDFATIELSSFYFDILKDRLYTAPAHSVRRRAAQTTLYRIADALVRVVAPLMCFTAEEVWSHLPQAPAREPSVHLARFVPAASLRDEVPPAYRRNLDNWPRLIAVRDAALKALEAARRDNVIHSPLEARLYLSAEADLSPLLEKYRAELTSLLIVSQVELEPYSSGEAGESSLPGLKIRIERALGAKCTRCWNYSEQVGKDEVYPDVCERCLPALHEIEAGAAD
ncbi:MAG TPA: class I tRNA ligase family protein, partial [Terriglobia bacterium]|nr:class I tRNA ligase family protein [Terriglobia bacterium]